MQWSGRRRGNHLHDSNINHLDIDYDDAYHDHYGRHHHDCGPGTGFSTQRTAGR